MIYTVLEAFLGGSSRDLVKLDSKYPANSILRQLEQLYTTVSTLVISGVKVYYSTLVQVSGPYDYL